MGRVILHCDMNNYFATVEEKFCPRLRKVPFAVCGDPDMRHNIVMAKNALAKKAGVVTGLSYPRAREICPDLEYVKANMQRYLDHAKSARQIYLKYTDKIIPYGMDEAWIDLSETGATMQEGRQIADLIRMEIMYSEGLSASVGVSDNLIFAKLGSDYKKPNGTTVITKENYRYIVWPLPACDLLFVGQKRKKVLAGVGINTIGDIARAEQSLLKRLFGKPGADIWRFSRGDDTGFRPEIDAILSIGNTITLPRDITDASDAALIIYLISSSVCARLRKHSMKACTISLSIKNNRWQTVTRRSGTAMPTDSVNYIFNRAYSLFLNNYKEEYPLRAIGIRVDNLIIDKYEQMALFEVEDRALSAELDCKAHEMIKRLGKLSFEVSAFTNRENFDREVAVCAADTQF